MLQIVIQCIIIMNMWCKTTKLSSWGLKASLDNSACCYHWLWHSGCVLTVGVSAANQSSFCLCFNRCFFLNFHLNLEEVGVYIYLKFSVLKNSSDSASLLCWVPGPTTTPWLHLELVGAQGWGARVFIYQGGGKRCKSRNVLCPRCWAAAGCHL